MIVIIIVRVTIWPAPGKYGSKWVSATPNKILNLKFVIRNSLFVIHYPLCIIRYPLSIIRYLLLVYPKIRVQEPNDRQETSRLLTTIRL